MIKASKLLLILVSAFFFFAETLPSSAETLTWRVRSNHPNTVNVEFYSQNRRHAWPGGKKVYVIRDYDTHSYRIRCRSGEYICYGAWVRGRSSSYWGVGKSNRNKCSSCCYSCDGGTTRIQVLNP